MTANERHRLGVFARDVHKCALTWAPNRCSGRLQADHLIEKQILREAQARQRFRGGPMPLIALDEIIADPDNGWVVCERHHDLKTKRLIWIPSRYLPDHFLGFVARYELEPELDQVFPAARPGTLRSYDSRANRPATPPRHGRTPGP